MISGIWCVPSFWTRICVVKKAVLAEPSHTTFLYESHSTETIWECLLSMIETKFLRKEHNNGNSGRTVKPPLWSPYGLIRGWKTVASKLHFNWKLEINEKKVKEFIFKQSFKIFIIKTAKYHSRAKVNLENVKSRQWEDPGFSISPPSVDLDPTEYQ